MFNFNKKKKNDRKDTGLGYSIEHDDGFTRTIGLPERFGVMNIEFKNSGIISDAFAEEIIKNAVTYATSDTMRLTSPSIYLIDNYGGYTWYCVTKHNNEFLYRLIVPDENNKAPWMPGCDPKFRLQFTDQDHQYNQEYKALLEKGERKNA